MASLLGKADSTLVAASFKAAKADVPKDLSSVYEKREEAFKTFQEGISDIFTNLNKEDKENEKQLKEKSKEAQSTGLVKTNDHMQTAYYDYIKKLRENLKNADTELEKAKAWSTIETFNNNTTNADALLANIVEDSDLNIFPPGSNERKLIIAMLDDYNKNGKTTNATWDEDKEDWVYTLPGSDFSKTLTEIRDAVGTKDLTAETSAGKIINNIAKSETNQPWESDDNNNIPGRRNDVYDDIMGTMPKDNDVLNMGKANIPGQRFSIEDLLFGRVSQGYNNPVAAELFDVLKTLDLDNDGIPGDKDDIKLVQDSFTTAENGVKLAREIIKDKSLYKEIIANSWTDISGSKMANIKKDDEELTWAQKMQKAKYEDYIKNRDKTGDDLGKLTYANMFEGGKDMYIPEEEVKIINSIGTSITNRSKIGKGNNSYTWDSEKETYVMQDGTIVPNKATLFKWFFKDQTLSPTFKESTFFKNIPEWDGKKWIKEDDGGGGGGKSKAVTIKNNVVKEIRLPWDVVASAVKKINGTWHVSEKVGYSGKIKWVKATQKQINKINKSYK